MVGGAPPPGAVVCREPALAAGVRRALANSPGWSVFDDLAPLRAQAGAARLLVHLDLPLHPAQLALRRLRARPGGSEWLLLEDGSPDSLLWAVCEQLEGVGGSSDPRGVQRVVMRCKDQRAPLERLQERLAEAPDKADGELEAIHKDLERAVKRNRRAEAYSLALLHGEGDS